MSRLSASVDDWQGHTFSRLAALPEEAEPSERAQLLAAQFVGTEIIHLGHDTAALDLLLQFEAALQTFAEGNSAAVAARTRGRILAICDALADHRAYFDTGPSA